MNILREIPDGWVLDARTGRARQETPSERLSRESAQQPLPGIEAAEKPRRRNRRIEGELQQAVVEWLRAKGIKHYSVNNGAFLGAGHWVVKNMFDREIAALMRDPGGNRITISLLSRMRSEAVKAMESAKHGARTRLQQMGMAKGVPDLIVPVGGWEGEEHSFETDRLGLVLELKTPDGKLSDEQKQWRDHFIDQGWRYVLGRTFEQVIEEVEDHLS